MNDLEIRCLEFAKKVRDYCRSIKNDTVNNVYIKQIVRSSSAIGANYIEANEKLGEKDLLMRLKIARREAKETTYWLALLENENKDLNNSLLDEAVQLNKILSAIILKVGKKKS